MQRIALWGIALLMAFSGQDASARTWFVDPASPAGGDGSLARPMTNAHVATSAAAAGDSIRLMSGIHSAIRTLSVDGKQRRILLEMPDDVVIRGEGRDRTILRAPGGSGALIFGVTASNVGRNAILEDLRIEGPCFQGINLRGASPLIQRVDILSDVTGGSSTAFDARDSSNPLCRDVVFDGGHGALFVEFGSSGVYEDCRIARRPLDGAAISDATPSFVRCIFEGAGRDGVVLNLGSKPRFDRCLFRQADRWTVRVASGYAVGQDVDMGGNQWFSSDVAVLAAAILDVEDNPLLGARVVVTPLVSVVSTEASRMGALKSRW